VVEIAFRLYDFDDAQILIAASAKLEIKEPFRKVLNFKASLYSRQRIKHFYRIGPVPVQLGRKPSPFVTSTVEKSFFTKFS
jgi:hypothetical protein